MAGLNRESESDSTSAVITLFPVLRMNLFMAPVSHEGAAKLLSIPQHFNYGKPSDMCRLR